MINGQYSGVPYYYLHHTTQEVCDRFYSYVAEVAL